MALSLDRSETRLFLSPFNIQSRSVEAQSRLLPQAGGLVAKKLSIAHIRYWSGMVGMLLALAGA